MPAHLPLLLDVAAHPDGLPPFSDKTRALLLLVHPTPAGTGGDLGRAFVADVLRANRFTVAPLSLQTVTEARLKLPAPGMVQSKHRLRELFEWLDRQQPALRGWPIGLVAFDRAANACIGALASSPLPALRSMVLLDGNLARIGNQLSRLNVPCLFVIGHSRSRQDQHRAALRRMGVAHRFEMLGQATQPQPARGALEAFACSTVEWLGQTLTTAGRPQPIASADSWRLQTRQSG